MSGGKERHIQSKISFASFLDVGLIPVHSAHERKKGLRI